MKKFNSKVCLLLWLAVLAPLLVSAATYPVFQVEEPLKIVIGDVLVSNASAKWKYEGKEVDPHIHLSYSATPSKLQLQYALDETKISFTGNHRAEFVMQGGRRISMPVKITYQEEFWFIVLDPEKTILEFDLANCMENSRKLSVSEVISLLSHTNISAVTVGKGSYSFNMTPYLPSNSATVLRNMFMAMYQQGKNESDFNPQIIKNAVDGNISGSSGSTVKSASQSQAPASSYRVKLKDISIIPELKEGKYVLSVTCSMETDMPGARRCVAFYDRKKDSFIPNAMNPAQDIICLEQVKDKEHTGEFLYFVFHRDSFPKLTHGQEEYDILIYVYDRDLKSIALKEYLGSVIWDGNSFRVKK